MTVWHTAHHLLLSFFTLFTVPRTSGPLITLTCWIDIILASMIVIFLTRSKVKAVFGQRTRA